MSDEIEITKRPAYGARVLENPSNVFQHNVWDNVQWDTEQEEAARKKVEKQAEQKIPEVLKEKLQKATVRRWDKFYDVHQNRFFKDRHWLFTEFPELCGDAQKVETPLRVFPSSTSVPAVDSSASETLSSASSELSGSQEVKYVDNVVAGSINESEWSNEVVQQRSDSCDSIVTNSDTKNYLEIGCGVGNTVFPILEYNIDPNLFVYCCDFSKNAVDILKSHEEYNPKRCQAFVCDVTADDWKAPFPASSIDISTLIFVLSAIHPQKMQHVVNQVYHYLKPGGLVMFRDYGRYDMAQLRFKEGQMMEDNFYARKDGTFVYFFTQEEVREMFCRTGFVEELSHVDRRLQVNRFRQLKMYRVWIQAKYRKPLS